MMRKLLLAALVALVPSLACAAVGTIYIDTGGATTNSGTTDTNSPPAGFSGASVDSTNTAGTTTVLPTNTNLSGLATDGSQAIFWNNATNSNQKIFWITGVTGCTGSGACSVTTSVATTCTTCNAGSWAIGGRMVYTSANFEAAVRPGDTVQINNTPASKAAVFFTARVAGDSTTGRINLIGKSGVRPVLATTGNNTVFSTGVALWYISNLEFSAAGTSAVISDTAATNIFDNIKISGTGTGIAFSTNSSVVIRNSEITGTGYTDGINTSSTDGVFINNYIHDVNGDGIEFTSTNFPRNVLVAGNIIDSVTGRGIHISGSIAAGGGFAPIVGNTIYNTTLSGLKVVDADVAVFLQNNIFLSNGTSSAFNVEWAAGNAQLISLHACNVFFQGAGGASGNLSNLTTNSTEFTTDPLLTDPANGNFTISSAASPAAGSGCTSSFLGATGTAYPDIGAMQRQVTAVGGRIIGSGL